MKDDFKVFYLKSTEEEILLVETEDALTGGAGNRSRQTESWCGQVLLGEKRRKQQRDQKGKTSQLGGNPVGPQELNIPEAGITVKCCW